MVTSKDAGFHIILDFSTFSATTNPTTMSEKQIVEDLQKIQPKLEGEHSDVASMRQATVLLGRLAKSLHEKRKPPPPPPSALKLVDRVQLLSGES